MLSLHLQDWCSWPRSGAQPLSRPPRPVGPVPVRCRTTQQLCSRTILLLLFFQSFNTTASGAGMCFFSCIIVLLRLYSPLILFVFKILPLGTLAFLSLMALSPFGPPTLAAQSQRLPFKFLVVSCPMLRFLLGFLTDLRLLPLICLGSTSLVDPFLSFVF